jgi:PHP family Zn ribbon phosphoesterase
VTKKRNRNPNQWYTIDLHIHTPASSDYQQPEITNLEILHRAEAKGLDIIALTDHNTVAGYRRLYEEIHQLELLEQLKRILPDEQARLSEYRRLMNKILVLPGFEFTATFGFHILAIFPPEKPVREIEHLLLDLNIPPEQIDEGAPTVGATSDVLTAYRLIQQAGGLVIAAHANSSNGVAMRGFPLGGQTKIAYTQDENLNALEVTDLEHQGRHTTATFFSGTKPEYPRRMHCIQGSDAHRLDADPTRKKNLGVGDRTTDILIPVVSFESLRDLFASNDFAQTRPHRKTAEPAFDFILAAREEGANIIQDFHENLTVRGGKRYAIIADVCAFANTNGGTLYIGISSDPKKSIIGIQDTEQAINQLEKEISNRISPPLQCTIDSYETGKKKIIRVLVPRGNDPPYAIDDSKIYVRSETETGLAVRDEIVSLVLRGPGQQIKMAESLLETSVLPLEAHQIDQSISKKEKEKSSQDNAPRTGVEVVSVEERNGVKYYTMRDLRNGSVVKNVTPKSARRLWHYAITSYAKLPQDPQQANFHWQGGYGLMRRSEQGKSWRYDLIQKIKGDYRYFFGVTDDGIHGPWKSLVGEDEDS